MTVENRRNPASFDSRRVLAAGVGHHQAGRLTEAENCYRQILQTDSSHADALHLLGVIACQVGRRQDAIDLIGRAIAINGNHPAYHANLAQALKDLGRLDEALAAHRAALRLQPDSAEAHVRLGKAFKDLGRRDEAEAAYRSALCVKPDFAQAHFDLANALRDLGRIDDAVAAFATALRIKPDYASAHVNLGTCLQAQGRPRESVAAYRAALCLKPDFAAVYSNLGNVLKDLGRLRESIAVYAAALCLQQDLAEAHSNLGNALRDLRRPDDAVRAYVTALCVRPGDFGPHYNLGIVLFQLGRLSQALAAFGAAVRLSPDDADAHHNLGLALLLLGRFEPGWREYGWRWHRRGFVSLRRAFPQPLWQGEDIAGKTILLHAEQGLGDAIQFCRYAPLVAAKGGRVILEVPRSLFRLFAGLPGTDALVAAGDPLPAFDLYCPLLSVPGVMGTNLDRIPPALPFAEDEARVADWRQRLRSRRRKIGIVWQGNPHHQGDRDRSVPLALFAALTKIAGVELISLQKGSGVDQIDKCPEMRRLVRLGSDYDGGDFAETASVLSALDLVITIDSAVAHLAGTLGLPTWVALPFVPDWRWLLDRDDTPWYPSLRLFRQRQRGAWHDVFDRMAVELDAMMVDGVHR